ncbi:MAG: OmpA family protein [Dinoroseobacter sp.]|nr:OmpA family protein [Dinoroseobacter sp.]
MKYSYRLPASIIFVVFVLSGCSQSRQTEVQLSSLFEDTVTTTVFFDFDKAELDATARAALGEQAAFILQYPTIWFRVEGHADRVGSVDYNEVLGLRRANAALEYLVSQGVQRSQLEAVVSFGEERPAIEIEARERRNRRVVTEVGGTLDPVCNCRKRPGVE